MMSAFDIRLNRRSALRRLAAAAGAGIAAPGAFRAHGAVPPSETVYHASFGASGMAGADIGSLTASKHLKLVAVADVDLRNTKEIVKRFPGVKVYQDWRQLLEKEKHLDSVNVSTPDHMHGPITLSALERGLNVYTQKPLTQTIHEAREVARLARDKKVVTQMGIQLHSSAIHQTIAATVRAGTIGKVKEVHSWSGKHWGDTAPKPDRKDPVPAGLDWDAWLGVAEERPFIAGYYHPGEWRKRLDFGTGTFGDMGCHILDPVFMALALTSPRSVHSEGGAPNADNWGLDSQVKYTFPGTAITVDPFVLHWYDGDRRPPAEVKALIGKHPLQEQGSIYIGEKGILYAPYFDQPVLLPADHFAKDALVHADGADHYIQFVEACRGHGKTSAPFDYSGPLTESVLLGCLATRFPKTTLNWDSAALAVTNVHDANRHVRRHYRKGWGPLGR